MKGIVKRTTSRIVTVVCANSGADLDYTIDICEISLNGQPASLKDIHAGDAVELSFRDQNVCKMVATREVVKEVVSKVEIKQDIKAEVVKK